jgi:hypothetical protein
LEKKERKEKETIREKEKRRKKRKNVSRNDDSLVAPSSILIEDNVNVFIKMRICGAHDANDK